MNADALIAVVPLSTSKVDCMNRLGLEHSHENFALMASLIRRHQIDISHLKPMKAFDYVQSMRNR